MEQTQVAANRKKELLARLAKLVGFVYSEALDTLLIPLDLTGLKIKLEILRLGLLQIGRNNDPISVSSLCMFIAGDGFKALALHKFAFNPNSRIGDYQQELLDAARSMRCESIELFGSLDDLGYQVYTDIYFFVRAIVWVPTRAINLEGLRGSHTTIAANALSDGLRMRDRLGEKKLQVRSSLEGSRKMKESFLTGSFEGTMCIHDDCGYDEEDLDLFPSLISEPRLDRNEIGKRLLQIIHDFFERNRHLDKVRSVKGVATRDALGLMLADMAPSPTMAKLSPMFELIRDNYSAPASK